MDELTHNIDLENKLDTKIYEHVKDSKILECYIKEIAQFELLDPESEKELLKKAKNGDERAKQKLINSNLRYVVYIARKYSFTCMETGIDLLDIVQEGNCGLIKALEKFNLDIDVRFTTYATYWIKQFILRYFQKQAKSISMSHTMSNKYNKLSKFETNFYKLEGRRPTINECSKQLGYTKS